MMGLSKEQAAQLLKPINPSRVLRDNKGQSHVSQQDVRAHLIRCFGFGGWETQVLELTCVRDDVKKVPAKDGRPERIVPAVTYRCLLRLTVRDAEGRYVASYDDVGTGTSPNLPDYGDAHDFAAKNAVSYALKRCAINLGDQFGLSLYNGGQVEALVRGTLVVPDPPPGFQQGDVQDGVSQQTELGDEAA